MKWGQCVCAGAKPHSVFNRQFIPRRSDLIEGQDPHCFEQQYERDNKQEKQATKKGAPLFLLLRFLLLLLLLLLRHLTFPHVSVLFHRRRLVSFLLLLQTASLI